MPAVLPNKTTTDQYKDTQLGGGSMFARGLLVIANNPVKLRVTTGDNIGEWRQTEYPFVSPTVVPLVSGSPSEANPHAERIIGVEVANAIPGSNAQVSGWLIEPGLAGPDIGNPFAQSITTGGGVTPGLTSLQISHNGTLIGTEPTLEFSDAALTTWSIVDDLTNSRVTASLAIGGTGTITFTDPAGTLVLQNKLLPGDTNAAFALSGDGTMQWGAGGGSVLDTDLHRYGPSGLATGGSFTAGLSSNLVALSGNVSGGAGIYFGNAYDTYVYRSAAGDLKTDGRFLAANDLIARLGATQQVIVGDDNAGHAGIRFGSAGDTVMSREQARQFGSNSGVSVYRAAAGDNAFRSAIDTDNQYRFLVRTDGYLQWGLGGSTAPDTNLYRRTGGILRSDGSIEAAGYLNPGANSLPTTSANGILFGQAADTNLYRSGNAALKTDGLFQVGGDFRLTGAGEVYLDPNNTMRKIYWGSAADTNLYRSAASVLKTDGHFRAGLTIAANNGLATQVYLGDDGAGNGGIFVGSAADAYVKRLGAHRVGTERIDSFNAGASYNYIAFTNLGSATSEGAFTTWVNGDNYPKWYCRGDGMHLWGGGSTSPDTMLYRSAAGVVRLDTSTSQINLSFAGLASLYANAAGKLVCDSALYAKDTAPGHTVPSCFVGSNSVGTYSTFSCVKNATGKWTITLTNAFLAQAVMLAVIDNNTAGGMVTVHTVNTTTFEIYVWNAAGAAADMAVNFLVIYPSG